MRRHGVVLSAMAILFVGALAWASQGTSDETKGLDEVLGAWEAGFNSHDAKAIAATYTEDAESVIHTGERMKGRAAIEKGMATYLAANPKVKTKLAVISRRFIKPDVVVEDGRWEESGHSKEGVATKGLFSTVLVKRGGAWQAAHDVGFVPVSDDGATAAEKK
jgi:uncharacterized protein (TIGR02246 family)